MYYGSKAVKLDRLNGIIKVPASSARTRFGAVIKRVRQGECVIVERDGVAEVAVISLDRLAAGFTRDHDKIDAVVARKQLDNLEEKD